MSEALQVVGKFGQNVLTSYGMKEQAKSNRRLAEARNTAAQFEAEQLEQDAGQTIAASQRAAREQERIATLVASRALAVAAASGGGASDTTVVNLIARIKGEGAYRAGVKLYEGEARARKLRLSADARRYEGAQGVVRSAKEQKVTNTLAMGNLLVGGSTLASKYGGDQPSGLGYGTAGSQDASAGGTYNSGAW